MRTTMQIMGYLGSFFGFIFLGVLFASCDEVISEEGIINEEEGGEEEVSDFVPVGIKIMVIDEDGINLLNPTIEGNWIGKYFCVTYNYDDKVYFPTWEYMDQVHTSAKRSPTFYGFESFQLQKWDGEKLVDVPNEHYFYFGEFDGSTNQDITLQLWNLYMNGCFDIELHHNVEWNEDTPVIKDTYEAKYAKEVSVKGDTIVVTFPRNDWTIAN